MSLETLPAGVKDLRFPVNIYTAPLPTVLGICIQFTRWHIAYIIRLLLGLLEVEGHHPRSGDSTACQSCCDPTQEKTNHGHFKHREGGKSDPLHTPGERSPSPPKSIIPPSQSSETSPEMRGFGKTSSYLYAGLVNFFSSSELQVG